jgi:hypothetical protein
MLPGYYTPRKQSLTIFFHAHLQVVYYKYVKFHKNPLSGFGGVALTSYMDGRTDGWTNGRTGWFLYTPQTLFAGSFELKWSFGGPLSKLCVTPPFSINFRCQIKNQVSDYRILGASSSLISKYKKILFRFEDVLWLPDSTSKFLSNRFWCDFFLS